MSTHNHRRRSLALLICAVGATAPGVVRAELRESQVLVVYDSRITDSLRVAEHYAGSSRVPGGDGAKIGVRRYVRVVDLASLPGAGLVPNTGNISYADFVSRFRDPLRVHLTTTGQVESIRCIVLTKGLPHRIQDINNANPNVGDQPGQSATLLNAGNLTYASVDSELTLLWQNLNSGEANGAGDSKADGGVGNPYFKQPYPINAYSTKNILATKNIRWLTGFGGILATSPPAGASGMTPGDMYLVCRLDGNTAEEVISAMDRARDVVIDFEKSTFIFDESGSNGTQNLSDSDSEYDNDGPSLTNAGDDYELTRDWMLADGRFITPNIVYNRWATADQFIVGPRVNFGGGVVVHGEVLLLGTYGNNHSGFPGVPGNAGTQYPFSFNYAPGAIFNTIESFNGRSFGGIGIGFTPQGQLADFIQAGGTFGIGNVWEPFSFSIPDNIYLVQNFLLGSLTWAEAAYSSFPLLSWQQVVVGDPLARVRRVQEDINGDEATNLEDIYAWLAPAARPRDLNHDGQINRADVEIMRNSVRGSESANMRPPGR